MRKLLTAGLAALTIAGGAIATFGNTNGSILGNILHRAFQRPLDI